jgi:hypothetical protein
MAVRVATIMKHEAEIRNLLKKLNAKVKDSHRKASEKDSIKVEVKIDMLTLGISVSSSCSLEDVPKTIDNILDSIRKSEKILWKWQKAAPSHGRRTKAR